MMLSAVEIACWTRKQCIDIVMGIHFTRCPTTSSLEALPGAACPAHATSSLLLKTSTSL